MRLLLCLPLLLALSSCDYLDSWDTPMDDEAFYDYTNVADYHRIPLIQPIDVISLMPEDSAFANWQVNFRGNWQWKYPEGDTIGNGMGLDSMTVVDSVAIVFQDTVFGGQLDPHATWYLFDTRDTTKRMYTTRESYLEACKEMNLGTPKLYSVHALWRQFLKSPDLPYRKN